MALHAPDHLVLKSLLYYYQYSNDQQHEGVVEGGGIILRRTVRCLGGVCQAVSNLHITHTTLIPST